MTDSAFGFRRNGRVGVSLPGLALVVLLHALAVWLLMSLDVMPRPVQLKPIMVRIIPPQIPAMGSGPMPAETQAPPQPVKPPEPPKAPKPVPPVKKALRPRPPTPVPPAPKAPAQEILAAPPAPAAASSENAVTAPPPAPVETAESEGGSRAASGQGSGGSGVGGRGGEGTQPRFDADYLHNPRPVYPPMSRRMGEEGKVFLRVRVEADGRPSQVEIKTSSGSQRLDQAAADAVRRWRFVPAKRGAEAVSAWVIVPISFNLKQ